MKPPKLLAVLLVVLMLTGCGGRGTCAPGGDAALLQTEDTISFETGLVQVTMNRTDSAVTAVTVKETGEALPVSDDVPWFFYINDTEGNLVLPVRVSGEGNTFTVEFESGMTSRFTLETGEEYYALRLETEADPTAEALFFGNVTLEEGSGWLVSAVPMTTNANPVELPGAGTSCGLGYTMAEIGTKGAKLAVVCTPEEEHRQALQRTMEHIDPAEGLVSHRGGPWAMEDPAAYGDYVIMDWGVYPETVEDVARMAADYSVEQIYLHQSWETFIQGSFTFPCALTEAERAEGMTADAALFRERIASVMEEHGIALGLHTYSSLVPDTAEDILTDPKWQKELLYGETYTLAEDIGPEAWILPTEESGESFFRLDTLIPWNEDETAYVLIDEEIVLVMRGEDGGLVVGCRGMLGTAEASHKAGAEIRHLSGKYGMFQPDPGSDLFYEVARRTGEACAAGGFDIIYLDGLESIWYFVPDGTEWYYYSEFIRTILEHCDAMMDYSTFTPATWNAQGKDGGVDYATRAYKQHKENHVEYNLYINAGYIPTALGWFHAAPDMDEGYKNTVTKTMFRDDLDRLGVLSLAYDMPLSFTPFTGWDMSGETRLADNMGYFALYSALWQGEYFAPSVKEALRDLEQEYRLEVTPDGYAFREMSWQTARFHENGQTHTLCNPYEEQAPILRVESRYSSLGEDAIPVLDVDETAEIWNLAGEYTFEPMDISGHQALKIRVYGTGSTEDAILISLRSVVLTEGGRTDYLLTLDHEGWKDFWLIDSDCGDTAPFVFDVATDGVDYECYRALVDMAQVNSVTVSPCGPCEGARLDDITAYVLAPGEVENPSVAVNGQTVTFETAIRGGEYIEYDPDSGRAYLYSYDTEVDDTNGRAAYCREIPVRGSITVPSGEFEVTYEAQALTDAPVRARVAVGTRGDLLQNPGDWEAPAVTVPAGAAAVWGE